MQVISGDRGQLPRGLYSSVARYRYQVFVERLGWRLDTEGGFELDQFDREDTLYVVAREEKGRIIGCARLLPTERPYLLEEVFPELLNGVPLPKSPAVWELSRFVSVDLERKVCRRGVNYDPEVSAALLREAIRCAAVHGAKRLITVSPLGVERLLRRAGFTAHRAGPPKVVDGYPLFACYIEIGAQR